MMGMLYPVGFYDLYFVADPYRKEHPVNRIALLYLFEYAGIPGSKFCCFIKACRNGIEETILRLCRHIAMFLKVQSSAVKLRSKIIIASVFLFRAGSLSGQYLSGRGRVLPG